MNSRELEGLLATLSGYPPGEIDKRIRPLREKSLIPHGPRGPHAFQLEAIHAALCVLCMASRRAVDGASVAVRAMDLQLIPRPGCPLEPKMALADALETAFLAGSEVVRQVDIASDGSLAWVVMRIEGENYRLAFTDSEKVRRAVARRPETYDSVGEGWCGHVFSMRAGAIDQVMLELNDDEEAGYAGSKDPKQ